MTCVYPDGKRNGWRLELVIRGLRRKLWLGRMPKRTAQRIRDYVDDLKLAIELAIPADPSTLKWAAAVDSRIADKLAAWGLIPKRGETAQTKRLSVLCADVIDRHSEWSPSHRTWMKRCAGQLVECLGDLTVDQLGEWHAEELERWMAQRYPTLATRAKQLQRAKQLLAGVGKLGIPNPLESLRPKGSVNMDRQAYVSLEVIERVSAQLPTLQLQWALKMARIAGLRIPSEILTLQWGDVDWDLGRLKITSPKQVNHPDKYIRVIPMFPPLRPMFDELHAQADEGAVYVFTAFRTSGATALLRKSLMAAIKRAGEKPWHRLWVNLRASARTDLLRTHPTHVVDAWLGHSGKIGAKHYNRITDEDFKRADAPESTPAKPEKPEDIKDSPS